MIRIVTDSTANLADALVQAHDIVVVPLKVQMGGQTYREGINLSQEEFFRRLPTADPLPTTSQPSPLEFEETYQALIDEGAEIISLHLSSDLSGTYNSARNGAMSVDAERISVIDTRSVSAGLGLLVLAAAQMAEAGQDRAAIVAAIEQLIPKVHLILTLDTLEYLKRGGRIGGAQALIGGLLRIKPTIVVQDGRLEAGERARSRRKAIDLLVQKQVEAFGNQPVWVGIAEAQADDVNELEQRTRAALNIEKLIRCQIGPVVATHTGPGTLGLVVMPVPPQS